MILSIENLFVSILKLTDNGILEHYKQILQEVIGLTVCNTNLYTTKRVYSFRNKFATSQDQKREGYSTTTAT